MRRQLVLLLVSVVGMTSCGVAAPSNAKTSPAPVLVQIENSATARPQSGLSNADVVYEYLTEGGISRFTAIYLHPDSAGQVGPVRSARLVTIRLAQHYQGLLVYAGAGTYVQQQIENDGLPRFTEDSAEGVLFRSSDRSAPHNLYADGSGLSQLLSKANVPSVGWELWARSKSAAGGGTAKSSFQVPISDYEQPTWSYDPSTDGYTRTEADTGPFIDADTNKPVVAGTVILQQVNVTSAPQVEDVNGMSGVEQDIDSGGKAQIFSHGNEYDATWSQPADGPPAFTLANGGTAPIAPGLVWIELVPAQ